jgi:hypothetical protein
MLAGAICAQCLRQKHRQSLGGRQQALSMHRQLNFHLIQRRIVSQQIEERMGVCGPYGTTEHA